jgi:hypothetical protein
MDPIIDNHSGLRGVKAPLEPGDLVSRETAFAGNMVEMDGVPGIVIIIAVFVWFDLADDNL